MSSRPRAITPVATTHVEPTIQCPHCSKEIKLTESLAAPLLRNKEEAFQRREANLRELQNELRRQGEAVRQQVDDGIAAERKTLQDEERKKAKLALSREMEAKEREVSDLVDLLKSREA